MKEPRLHSNVTPPLVSFIVPSYNHSKYIATCLNSIRDEKYPNKELIIIDDGSTDKSGEIIENWIDLNGASIKTIYKKRLNMGVCATLNELTNLTNGQYITPIASDDFLLPYSTFRRVNYLQKNPDNLAVFGDCIVVDESNHILYRSALTGLYNSIKSNLKNKNGISKEIITNWSVPGPALMYERDLLKKIGLYNENYIQEDWDFYLRMASVNTLGYIDYPVAAYRVHADNACRQKEKEYHNKKCALVTITHNIGRFSGRNKIFAIYTTMYCSLVFFKSLFLYKSKKIIIFLRDKMTIFF